MNSSGSLDSLILGLSNRVDLALGLILFIVRFTVCFSMVPGLGQGPSGLAVRGSAIIVLSAVSALSTTAPTIPDSWAPLLIMVVSELSLGLLLGIIPQLIVSATHLAGSLASTAMGLGASQLFDPTLGEQSTSVGKLYSDLGVIIFLLINGHHTVIAAASGLANTLPAGVFSPSTQFVLQLTGATSIIFKLGLIISAPIVSTLLITQFILGVLSKTVPSINVFFISFPVTVAIGLTLAAASLPSVVVVLEKGFIDICQLLLNSLN